MIICKLEHQKNFRKNFKRKIIFYKKNIHLKKIWRGGLDHPWVCPWSTQDSRYVDEKCSNNNNFNYGLQLIINNFNNYSTITSKNLNDCFDHK